MKQVLLAWWRQYQWRRVVKQMTRLAALRAIIHADANATPLVP